ncbi:HupE/UreJ family protein [Rhodohalobacter sulfatireducens]|uniref:HupE/UreJ family protein n=1 Tax=Rhodohalobacter sulfatireducens TaxID=2911366 RepID=A0ABS9KJ31_9BACT|nr:HupE/UreJ family protein [Rhodohalobacter sulfatireducens]MCG2590812.1 HupE/UreJ family protein [Rhodohalobacter sulfatireducens]
MKKILIILSLFLVPNLAEAHNPGQSYLYFSTYEDRIDGDVQAKAQEWNAVLGTNLPKNFTKEDLEAILPQIHEYIRDNLTVRSELGEHPITFVNYDVLNEEGSLGTFSRILFRLDNVTTIPENLEVTYDLFFESDDDHRALLLQAYNWKAGIIDNESVHSAIFSPGSTTQELDLSKATTWNGFISMVKMGIWHIWIGIDHIFFLLALALPAVVTRLPNRKSITEILSQWTGVEKFKPAFWYLVKVVTFFTIAHSITLSLAALGVINLNARIVESIIALSIALAALHNIVPIFKQREWLIAFGFGLFHGFGFAGVLADKGLSGEYMALTLFGFNFGVEVGQLLIILLFFPVLFFMRKTKVYSYSVVIASAALILLSLIWTYERFFDVNIPLRAITGL